MWNRRGYDVIDKAEHCQPLNVLTWDYLYAAAVGGPSHASDYSHTNSRSHSIANEVAIDDNTGLTGALAFATQNG